MIQKNTSLSCEPKLMLAIYIDTRDTFYLDTRKALNASSLDEIKNEEQIYA